MDAKRAALTQMLEGGGGAPSGITSNSRWARVSPADMQMVGEAAKSASGAIGKAAHLGGMGLIGLGAAGKLAEGDPTGAALEGAYLLPGKVGLAAFPISEALSTGSGPALDFSSKEAFMKSLGSARPVSEKEEQEELKSYKTGKKESFMPLEELDVSKLSDEDLLAHYKKLKGLP